MTTVLAFDLGNSVPWGTGQLSSKFPSVATLVSLLLRNSFTIAGLLLLVFLIYGGLLYIIGAGSSDPKKAQQAQGIITTTLIGFLIVFLSFFIIQIVEVVTGLNILNSNL